MKIFFRVDANKKIGSGHLSRCANLALTFKNHGIESSFIVNKNDFFNFSHIPSLSYEFISASTMKEDVEQTSIILSKNSMNFLVLDSYLHDIEWEKLIHPHVKKMLVWDDLANRKHSCDILVDCGVQREKSDYKDLVLAKTEMLIGPRYCPISQEIKNVRNSEVDYKAVHLFFGSMDSGEFVMSYYRELVQQLPDYRFHIAIANQSSNDWAKEMRTQDKIFIARPMSESLSGCSLAIGAPGTTTWERIFLGIFGFYISINSNQIQILQNLEALGVCQYVGEVSSSPLENVGRIAQQLKKIDWKSFKKTSAELVDGQGLERIVEEVLK